MKKEKKFMTDDEVIRKLNKEIYKQAALLNEKYKDSMLVATSYLAVATKILRSIMDEDNYRLFMDHISEENVPPFNNPTLH
jgi:predicted nucleic acid-binding protein